MRAGFPHSDILGSKLACQLPEAYRRLQRPSSPVVAKASTTCTYSLDPITLSTARRRTQSHRSAWRAHGRLSHGARNAISYPVNPIPGSESDPLYFFRIVKEPSNQNASRSVAARRRVLRVSGGANRDRTGDLLLAKQALSQLSYGPRGLRRRDPVGGSGWTRTIDPRLIKTVL